MGKGKANMGIRNSMDLNLEDKVLKEIKLRTSRSSGPGGQHANSASSRVEAVFSVAKSKALSEEEKERLSTKLGPQISAYAQDSRGQARNRELATERLLGKIQKGLKVAKKRTATKPSKAKQVARLEAKRKHSQKKAERRGSLDY